MGEDVAVGAAGLDEPEARPQSPPTDHAAEANAAAAAREEALEEERREDDAIGQLLSSLAHCTSQAMGLRKGDQPTRAIRQMERAVKMCQGREHSHPALAVEASRARLNLGGLLSCAGRHMEAVDVIKDAQFGLASILAWAGDCEPGDPGVDAIATEARTLHCAALVAEAIELEPFAAASGSPGHSPPERQRRRGMHEELYHEARSVAEDALPNSHPMASLAARLSEECAVCARPAAAVEQPPAAAGRGAGAAARGAAPRASTASVVLPAVQPGMRSSSSAGAVVSMPPVAEASSEAPATPGAAASEREASASVQERSLNASGDMGSSEVGGMSSGGVLQANSDAGRSGVTRRSRTSNAAGAGRTHQPKSERHDVFSDFLRGAELEKEARLGPLHESMQDDVRKRLNQVHRTTRLQLELLDDDELREKRYTRTGHRVFMRNLARDNSCRSDPNLVAEARKMGESPELAQIKKLYRQLYIPPRTPEPVKVAPKPMPEVDFLKETGANSFKRTKGFGKVPDVF